MDNRRYQLHLGTLRSALIGVAVKWGQHKKGLPRLVDYSPLAALQCNPWSVDSTLAISDNLYILVAHTNPKLVVYLSV